MGRCLGLFAIALIACSGHKADVNVVAKAPTLVSDIVADDHGVAWLAQGKNDETELMLLQTGGAPVVVAHGTLFSVALDADHVFWSDGEHVWRSPRDKIATDQIVENDDVTRYLAIDGGSLYWATPTKIGRIALTGGTSQEVARAPEVGKVRHVAVSVGHVVASVPLEKTTELWQLDGETHRLGSYPGIDNALRLDGDTVVWGRLNGSVDEVLVIGLDGHDKATVQGALLDAKDGTVFIERRGEGSYAYKGGATTRLGPRATVGSVAAGKLYGAFDKTIGWVPVVR